MPPPKPPEDKNDPNGLDQKVTISNIRLANQSLDSFYQRLFRIQFLLLPIWSISLGFIVASTAGVIYHLPEALTLGLMALWSMFFWLFLFTPRMSPASESEVHLFIDIKSARDQGEINREKYLDLYQISNRDRASKRAFRLHMINLISILFFFVWMTYTGIDRYVLAIQPVTTISLQGPIAKEKSRILTLEIKEKTNSSGHKEGRKKEIHLVDLKDPTLEKLTPDSLITLTITDPTQVSGDKEDSSRSNTLNQATYSVKDESHKESVYEYAFSYQENGLYTTRFSVKDDGLLSIFIKGEIFEISRFQMIEENAPEVVLTSPIKSSERQDDSEVIPLSIRLLSSDVGIKKVSLSVRMGDKPEPLIGIRSYGDKNITHDEIIYELLPKIYLTEDEGKIYVQAFVEDKSLPNSKTGKSEILEFFVVSAYGRYQEFLARLGKIEHSLYEKDLDQNNLIEEQKELGLLVRDSLNIAFFDMIDRLSLQYFYRQSLEAGVLERRLDLARDLSNFLREHEQRNDQERDRDFFVLQRSLSMALGQKDRSTSQKEGVLKAQDFQIVLTNLSSYLNERHQRWKLRTEKLTDLQDHPQYMEVMKKNVLQTKQKRLQDLVSQEKLNNPLPQKTKDLMQKYVMKMAAEYDQWLKLLEEHEEKRKQDMQAAHQESFDKIKEVLKDLQSRQTEISTELNESSDPEKIKPRWPVVRMLQNTNSSKMMQLIKLLEPVSIEAAKRAEHAKKAMDEVLTVGDKQDYQQAESFADLANRLLRLTEKQHRESKESNQSPRQRQSSGPNDYFGRSIEGGHIELDHTYEVDRSYREGMLKEAAGLELPEEKKQLMEDFFDRTIE